MIGSGLTSPTAAFSFAVALTNRALTAAPATSATPSAADGPTCTVPPSSQPHFTRGPPAAATSLLPAGHTKVVLALMRMERVAPPRAKDNALSMFVNVMGELEQHLFMDVDHDHRHHHHH